MTILGTADRDLLDGTGAPDKIAALGGDDLVNAFDGDDKVWGGAGVDDIYGGSGADTLHGGDGGDDLVGDAGDDLLLGEAGDDQLWGGDGYDRVYGGSGDDAISDSTGGDSLDGGAGSDTLDLSYLSFFGGGHAAVSVAFDSSGAAFATPDGSTAVNFEHLSIFGSNYDDTIAGGDKGDTLIGWDGADELRGGRGADLVAGTNGDDRAWGDAGADTVTGGGGSDTLYGGAGDDTLVGGSVGDVYWGDDTLVGGAGADLLEGGPKATTISYADSAAAVVVDFKLGVGHGGDAEGDRLSGGDGWLGIRGAVIGSAFADTIVGGVSQFGGAGDDRLETSINTVSMTGGAGRDTFAFTNDDGYRPALPVVTDFDQAAHETLDVSAVYTRHNGGPLRFIGTEGFSGEHAGEVRFQQVDGITVVEISLNKAGDAYFGFTLDGTYTLTAADFAL